MILLTVQAGSAMLGLLPVIRGLAGFTPQPGGERARWHPDWLAITSASFRTAWLTLSATVLASATHAAPLTYNAALDLAERSAPDIQARMTEVEAAQAAAVAAGRLPDPRLRIGADNYPVSGPVAGRFGPDSMTMATLKVIQDVPSDARRRAEKDRASASISAAQAEQLIEARNVRSATALAWVDLYYAERRLAALQESEVALQALRDTAPSQLAAGTVRPAESLEADQLLAVLADRRADLTAAVTKARAELARWTGDPVPEAAGKPPAAAVDPGSLLAGLDQHPSLLAYDAMDEQAAAELALARAQKHPDWSWELAYQRRDPIYGDMVTLGVTISLPMFADTRQNPVIASRVSLASRVRSEREAARRTLEAQLDADVADHVMHHERLMRSQRTLVPLAQRRLDLERSSYAAGSARLSDVLHASTALAEARIDALDREAEVLRDAVRINLAYEAARP